MIDDEILRTGGLEHMIKDKIKHVDRNTHGKSCYDVWELSQHDDFKHQLKTVEETLIKAGHKCIFLPKFHPELNFINHF